MDQAKMASLLLEDAITELNYKKLYHKTKENGSVKEWALMRTPSKQRIKDDLKMLRRITLEIERGLDDEQ